MRKVLLLALCLLLLASHLFAGTWNRVETEYTTIIFEERDVQYAYSIASYADEVLLELSDLLDHMPKRKVPVILSGRPAVSNGLFSFFPASIILYLTSPVDRFLGSRSSSWLRSLYTHELTHYLHLSAPVGPAKYLFFLGPEVPAMNGTLMPLWWVEGITTYTESEYAQGGRGDSPLFALTWQSPMLEDSLWSLSQGRYNSAFPPSARIYSTGYLMVDYLTRHYGRGSFARVNTAFTWFPFFGLNKALKKETGFSSKALFALALEEQKALLPKGSSPGELFSPEEGGNYYLPSSTERGLTGYSHTLERGGAFLLYPPDGGVTILKDLPYIDADSISFTPTSAVFSFVWSDPFHPSSLPLAPVSYSDLMLYTFSTDSFTRITEKAMLAQPAFDDEGGRLFAIERTGDRHILVSIDLGTGLSTLLYENPEGSVFEPVLAKENSVVVVEIVEGNSSLLSIDERGRATVLVPPTRSEIRSPVFSDGSIFFVSDDTGFLALYRYDYASEEVSLLLADPQGILKARVEGSSLLYETYRAQGVALKQVPLAHLASSVVTLQGPTLREVQQAQEKILFSSGRFVDYPRLNVVLPFPFVSENTLQPGLWLHSRSLLRRQLLIAQVGWDTAKKRLVGNIDYEYMPGPYTLGLNLFAGEEIGGAATLALPVLYRPSLSQFQLLSLRLSLGFVTKEADLQYSLSTLLGYQVKGRSRPKDFFGPPSAAVSLGAQLAFQIPLPARLRLFGSVAAQTRLFSSSQMLSLSLDGVTDNNGELQDALPYTGFSDNGLDGLAKTRLSLRYHIPLGLLDLPIPYGGLTDLGLSFSLQSSLYLRDRVLLWDEEVVVAGRLIASLVVGSGLEVQPFVALAYRVGDGKLSFSLGLNGGALFITEERPLL